MNPDDPGEGMYGEYPHVDLSLVTAELTAAKSVIETLVKRVRVAETRARTAERRLAYECIGDRSHEVRD